MIKNWSGPSVYLNNIVENVFRFLGPVILMAYNLRPTITFASQESGGGGGGLTTTTVAALQTLAAGSGLTPGAGYLITDGLGSTAMIVVMALDADNLVEQCYAIYQNAAMSAAMTVELWYDLDNDAAWRIYEASGNNDVSRHSFAEADTISNFKFDDTTNCYNNVLVDCKLLNMNADYIIESSVLKNMVINSQSHTGLSITFHTHTGYGGSVADGAEIFVAGDSVIISNNVADTGTRFNRIGDGCTITNNNFGVECYLNFNSHDTCTCTYNNCASNAGIGYFVDGDTATRCDLSAAASIDVDVLAQYVQMGASSYANANLNGVEIGAGADVENGTFTRCQIGQGKTIDAGGASHTGQSWIGNVSTFSGVVDCDTELTAGVLTIPGYLGYIKLISTNATETINDFVGFEVDNTPIFVCDTGLQITWDNSVSMVFPSPAIDSVIPGDEQSFVQFKQVGAAYLQVASVQYTEPV